MITGIIFGSQPLHTTAKIKVLYLADPGYCTIKIPPCPLQLIYTSNELLLTVNYMWNSKPKISLIIG